VASTVGCARECLSPRSSASSPSSTARTSSIRSGGSTGTRSRTTTWSPSLEPSSRVKRRRAGRLRTCAFTPASPTAATRDGAPSGSGS
jgi:hypothetical protein